MTAMQRGDRDGARALQARQSKNASPPNSTACSNLSLISIEGRFCPGIEEKVNIVPA
jgi:hypothetical protein